MLAQKFGYSNGDQINYEEYKRLCKEFDGKIEYIDGQVYMFAGGEFRHTKMINKITYLLRKQMEGKKCEPYSENPWYYYNKLNQEVYVQPDISIVCDGDKYSKGKYFGNIKFVIEVLSPNTKDYDRGEKCKLYKSLGVIEYLLVDMDSKSIECFNLSEESPFSITHYLQYEEEYTYISKIYKDIRIDLKEIFAYV